MRKVRSNLVFSIVLLFMVGLMNCQTKLQSNTPWKQVDIVIKTLLEAQCKVQKTTLTEEFQKDHIALFDQNDILYFGNKKEVDINTVKKTNIYNYLDIRDDDLHKTYPNELLNPETFIGGSIASTLPMDLFQIQNQPITLDVQDKIYSVYQDNKTILTGTMIAFLNPWIITTQHPIDNKDQMWEYTAFNTETSENVPISLPGLIQSIEKMDNHLLLKVVDQVFFNTTQWIFLTEEKRVILLGSNYAEIYKIGEFPDSDWCIVSDWYNREL